MNKILQGIFEKAEADRLSILKLVEIFPEEKLSQHPENKWSVNQILSHLIVSERLSLLYMKKKSLGIDNAGNTGVADEIKYLILKISQRLPLRFKAPELLGSNPPDKLSYKEIVSRWDTVRKDLRVFIESLPDEHVHKKIYKHPVAGRLNVIHAVSFLREHVNHHLPQIKRLL